MGFDPASFSGGFGAGESQGRQDGDARANQARADTELKDIELQSARHDSQVDMDVMMGIVIQNNLLKKEVSELKVEINKRWIPYAVGLRAGLTARRAERQVLLDELKRLDPNNAEAVARRAEKTVDTYFDTTRTGGKNVEENYDLAMSESKERRRN